MFNKISFLVTLTIYTICLIYYIKSKLNRRINIYVLTITLVFFFCVSLVIMNCIASELISLILLFVYPIGITMIINRGIDSRLFFYITLYMNIFIYFIFINILLLTQFINALTNHYLLIIIAVILTLLCCLLPKSICSMLDKLNVIPKMKNITKNKECFFVINIVFLICILCLDYILVISGQMNIYFHLLSITLYIVWLWILYSINSYYNLKESKANARYLLEIYDGIEKYQAYYKKDNECIHKLNHDFKNHLLILDNLRDSESINDYVDKLSASLSDIKLVNSSGSLYIDAIIQSLKQKYPELTMDCHFYLSSLDTSLIELCPLFFNLIENACEGATKYNGRVELSIEYCQPHLLIEIFNTCDQKPDFVTKKGDGHGYGMKIVNEIVNQYQGGIEYDYWDGQVCVRVILTL